MNKKNFAEMKAKIKHFSDNYPDVDAMVEKGELTCKSGWYEATSKEAPEKIGRYANAVRTGKNGKAQFKLRKMSKQLKTIASKL